MSCVIKIDKNKCKGEGSCTRVCPLLLLEMKDGIPQFKTQEHADSCIECGHCLALCALDAITLNDISAQQCKKVNKNINIKTEELEEFIINRRSIRNYQDKEVNKEIISRLLNICRWTPTTKNIQAVEWTVISNKEKVKELAEMTLNWFEETNFPRKDMLENWNAGIDMISRGAPCLIIAHEDQSKMGAICDCNIALTSLELLACSMGLGTLWAGLLMRSLNNSEKIAQKVNLPKDHKVYAALLIGYPKVNFSYIPPRKEVKVNWL